MPQPTPDQNPEYLDTIKEIIKMADEEGKTKTSDLLPALKVTKIQINRRISLLGNLIERPVAHGSQSYVRVNYRGFADLFYKKYLAELELSEADYSFGENHFRFLEVIFSGHLSWRLEHPEEKISINSFLEWTLFYLAFEPRYTVMDKPEKYFPILNAANDIMNFCSKVLMKRYKPKNAPRIMPAYGFELGKD